MISFTSKVTPDAIIFFSKLYNNFLTAILYNKDNNYRNTDIPRLDAELYYLIIFKNNKIYRVFKEIGYH